MKTSFSRVLSVLLVLILLLGAAPMPVHAADTQVDAVQQTHINPLYKDTVTEADLVYDFDPPAYFTDPVYSTTVADAGVALREAMEYRVASIPVYYQTDELTYPSDTFSQDVKAIMREIFAAATEHTGNPTEGDYLLWQYAGWSCKTSTSIKGDTFYLTFTYSMTYYTTYEQEEAVTEEVEAVLESLDLEKKTDYYKVKAVYDYITRNVSYDYDNLYDNSYKLKHSAYAALINRTAVCQGYAILLYRFALEMGIDCRLIAGYTSGGGHGWNIIKLGESYYNLDSTWDAGLTDYRWFLKTQDSFPDHYRYQETDGFPYDTEEFHTAYPMADSNYEITTVASGDLGEGLSWSIDSEGSLTVSGAGPMPDWTEESPAPWSEYAAAVHDITLGSGITHVGSRAFDGCGGAVQVTFLGSAPTFGTDSVFGSVTADVAYPSDDESWNAELMLPYGGTLSWGEFCSSHSYEEAVTAPGCNSRGYTAYTCDCGYSYNDNFTDPLDHSFIDYVSDGNATCISNGTETATCQRCDATDTREDDDSELGHTGGTANCCEAAICQRCGEPHGTVDLNNHIWDDATCKLPKTCSLCGKTEGDPLTHNFQNGTCSACGAADPDYIPPATDPEPTEPDPTEPDPTESDPTEPDPTEPEYTGVTRVAGEDRFDTAFKVADQLKENLGIEKFSAIIVASGGDFADALSGSYLAAVKNAPILLGYKAKQNALVQEYIRNNLAEGGTVYILGGTKAIPADMEAGLSGLNVVRLAGENRFETNLLVLKEAGVAPGEEILVATGTDFADCLSGSATGKPILLVYKRLMDSQKAYLPTLDNRFCIIGGLNAVNADIEDIIRSYGETIRLAGKNRLETSVLVAERYFENPKYAVVAYGWNYPDGLCGGSLAHSLKGPLLLTHSKEQFYAIAAEYAANASIAFGYVLGGDGLVSDEAADAIFPK